MMHGILIFILLEETEQWNKYGDPEILKNSNLKKMNHIHLNVY